MVKFAYTLGRERERERERERGRKRIFREILATVTIIHPSFRLKHTMKTFYETSCVIQIKTNDGGSMRSSSISVSL